MGEIRRVTVVFSVWQLRVPSFFARTSGTATT
jgi:hypothetical protein